jgi:hypothetical protein
MGSLIIAFSSPGKKPLSVATVDDPKLLHRAAQLAIRQAEQRLAQIAESDPMMALLQSAEVRRLRTVLEILAPGSMEPMLNRSDVTLSVM